MQKETIRSDIQQATITLLEMAKEQCWNKISDNCVYYLTYESEYLNAKPFELLRKKVFKNKSLLTLEIAIEKLEKMFADLYDVNLFILKTDKNQTIVEIRCDLKSKFDKNRPFEKEYYETIQNAPPMLHCKMLIPPYIAKIDGSDMEKYDIHWELGGFKHWWKLFWWRRKMKKKIE